MQTALTPRIHRAEARQSQPPLLSPHHRRPLQHLVEAHRSLLPRRHRHHHRHRRRHHLHNRLLIRAPQLRLRRLSAPASPSQPLLHPLTERLSSVSSRRGSLTSARSAPQSSARREALRATCAKPRRHLRHPPPTGRHPHHRHRCRRLVRRSTALRVTCASSRTARS